MSAARTSNLCGEVDSGGWDEEKERGGMGYSESISAHTVITTTDNRGYYVNSKCMRNESAVYMSHACMWTSWLVDVICVACDVYTPTHTGQRRAHGHAQTHTWAKSMSTVQLQALADLTLVRSSRQSCRTVLIVVLLIDGLMMISVPKFF